MPKPIIILDRPQLGENIGMVARAMMNFELNTLRIVNPRDGWPNDRAYATASGADTIIDNVQKFETLRDAVADLNIIYATTSRYRDMVKTVHTPRSACTEILTQSQEGKSIGIVFGAERTGIENEDITLADALITYPTNPDFSSLNLAQAVLLMAYELFSAQIKDKGVHLKKGHSPFATKADLDNFLNRLFIDLDEKGFFKTKDMTPVMKQNIENIFVRGQLTEQEVNTLHGIMATLKRHD